MRQPGDFDDEERAFLVGPGAVLPAGRATCPSPDVLTAALEGVLPESWQQQVDAHVAVCSLCCTLAASLREVEPEPLTALESGRIRARLHLPALPVVRSETHGRWSRWWAAIGLAAAGAAAAVTMLVVANQSQPGKPAFAEGKKDAVASPEARTASIAARIPLAAAPLRLPLAALTMRGEEPSTEQPYLQKLGAALQPYRAGRYDEAATALAALASAYPNAVEPVFYEGVALLFTGQPGAAAQRLERARALRHDALAGEIPWYQAIAYERSGRASEAQSLLQTICGQPGPHRAEACKIASDTGSGK